MVTATKAPVTKHMSDEEKKFLEGWDRLTTDDAKYALDIAAMELMYIDLDVHRRDIEAKAAQLHQDNVRKVQRAAAKTILNKHLKGQHDQREHGNWARQAQSFVEEAMRRTGVRPEQKGLPAGDVGFEVTPEGEASGTPWRPEIDFSAQPDSESRLKSILGNISELPNRISSATERATEGMREFLSGSTWGERILAGAAFLSRSTNAVSEAAKLIATYGPIAGGRMVAAYFRYGGFDVELKETGQPGAPPKPSKGKTDEQNREVARTWALNRLKGNLPDEDTMGLSKGKAPSEGFIIASDGTVIGHAVGRGSDYYLPFGLRHLRMLRKDEGGEFVRRRALGGITVEDLHAGMMLGADKITVISNSGVFTMDITDRAKGMRTEHVQILARFQDLLRREGRGEGGERWNFHTYNTAMKALAQEFPLHFDNPVNRAGANPSRGDMNHPRRTLIQEFREIFGIRGVGATPSSGDEPIWRKAMRDAGRMPPERITNQRDAEEWLRAKARMDPGSRMALNKYEAAKEGNTYTPPRDKPGLAGRITQSQPVGGERKFQDAGSAVNTFDDSDRTPRSGGPVQVTQTKDLSEEEKRRLNAELRREQNEIKRTHEQAEEFARQMGNVDFDSENVTIMNDMIDMADDFGFRTDSDYGYPSERWD